MNAGPRAILVIIKVEDSTSGEVAGWREVATVWRQVEGYEEEEEEDQEDNRVHLS